MVFILIIQTFFFAFSYQFISSHDRQNGILAIDIKGNQIPVGLSDAIYFSVVTEATLGYGDIRPVGWSRGLACLQVTIGLILAGLFVAKLTSAKDRKLRFASSNSEGNWIEFFRTPQNELAVAFVNIFNDGETLHYNGTNYSFEGQPIEDFDGNLISIENSVLTFYFSNVKNNLFNNGISILSFRTDGVSDKWEFYDAELFDLVANGRKTVFFGVRVDKNQMRIVNSSTAAERKKVFNALYAKFEVELKERSIVC